MLRDHDDATSRRYRAAGDVMLLEGWRSGRLVRLYFALPAPMRRAGGRRDERLVCAGCGALGFILTGEPR